MATREFKTVCQRQNQRQADIDIVKKHGDTLQNHRGQKCSYEVLEETLEYIRIMDKFQRDRTYKKVDCPVCGAYKIGWRATSTNGAPKRQCEECGHYFTLKLMLQSTNKEEQYQYNRIRVLEETINAATEELKILRAEKNTEVHTTKIATKTTTDKGVSLQT